MPSSATTTWASSPKSRPYGTTYSNAPAPRSLPPTTPAAALDDGPTPRLLAAASLPWATEVASNSRASPGSSHVAPPNGMAAWPTMAAERAWLVRCYSSTVRPTLWGHWHVDQHHDLRWRIDLIERLSFSAGAGRILPSVPIRSALIIFNLKCMVLVAVRARVPVSSCFYLLKIEVFASPAGGSPAQPLILYVWRGF
jgi:hypothetical protein